MTADKLKSISERLRYLARDNNSYRNYIDQRIKSENLQFNLSLILAHLILNLKFIDRSREVFVDIIEEYNRVNKSTLTFNDFEKINWIRTVAGEIVMPELVRHYIWTVGYHETEGKPIEITSDKNDLVRCLQIYSQRCFEDSKLTISKSELEKILSKRGSNEITIEFLIESNIIGLVRQSELYYWRCDNEHSKTFKKRNCLDSLAFGCQ